MQYYSRWVQHDNEPPPLGFTYVVQPVPGPDLTVTRPVLSSRRSNHTCCSCKDNCRDAQKYAI
jgi:hypothetical protein